MKKVYLVHRWGGSPDEPWYNWLSSELEKKGFQVEVFDMPNTEHPKIEEWVGFLRDNVEDVDEHTYFVGHSIGCQTILRFLEKLHRHKKIGGCVFVAPWLDLINMEDEEMAIAHPWINNKINFDRIRDHTANFLALFSDNDPYVHLDEVKKFKENLGAKVLIKSKKGHFEEVEKIPEILEFFK